MLSQIQSLLPDFPQSERIHYFPIIDSTNTYAKQLAANGAPEGTVILADQQTGGRGRLGRSFSSPAGMGIYLSMILRPNCPPAELMHLTCAAGLAASNAVAAVTGRVPGIKWTNDLILARRKLGGILTELSVNPATGNVDWVVVGVGINCCQKEQDFPEEIRNIAISLGLPTARRAELVRALISELTNMGQELLQNKAQILQSFRDRCVTIGQTVSILRGEEVSHGTAMDVDDQGALVVRYDDGHIASVTSGEVSIRGMYGYI